MLSDEQIEALREALREVTSLVFTEELDEVEQARQHWMRRAMKAEAELVALRERVEAIHQDGGDSRGFFDGEYTERDHCCTTCGTRGVYGVEWPCATIRALAGSDDD